MSDHQYMMFIKGRPLGELDGLYKPIVKSIAFFNMVSFLTLSIIVPKPGNLDSPFCCSLARKGFLNLANQCEDSSPT